MKKSIGIGEREQVRRHQLTDLVLTNREAFRAEATKAYTAHTPKEREILAGLETRDISSYELLTQWNDGLRPLQHVLESKRSDDAFRKLIVKHLVLSENETQRTIDRFTHERESDVLRNFILHLYPLRANRRRDSYRKQRSQVQELLLRPESEIEQLKNHLTDYLLYKEIAHRYHVTVLDLYDSLLRRIGNRIRLRIERSRAARSEKARLRYVKSRLDELSALYDGLLVAMFDKGLDLIVILGLRNHYEKSITELPKDDAKNIVTRLAVFDSETQQFKNKYIETLAINPDQISLEMARTMTKTIDTLLLRVFDLTTVQKNLLLLQMKEYRELTEELAAITSAQDNRTAAI